MLSRKWRIFLWPARPRPFRSNGPYLFLPATHCSPMTHSLALSGTEDGAKGRALFAKRFVRVQALSGGNKLSGASHNLFAKGSMQKKLCSFQKSFEQSLCCLLKNKLFSNRSSPYLWAKFAATLRSSQINHICILSFRRLFSLSAALFIELERTIFDFDFPSAQTT